MTWAVLAGVVGNVVMFLLWRLALTEKRTAESQSARLVDDLAAEKRAHVADVNRLRLAADSLRENVQRLQQELNENLENADIGTVREHVRGVLRRSERLVSSAIPRLRRPPKRSP